ncbi:hypothetical protein XENORESO_000359 [Xenotaenia resolanae]|uniref:Uncharacterized protein n=1 Tax=Xenotaenia resolanae TaxID=208358 RepID=A0ABV0X011_9TELE
MFVILLMTQFAYREIQGTLNAWKVSGNKIGAHINIPPPPCWDQMIVLIRCLDFHKLFYFVLIRPKTMAPEVLRFTQMQPCKPKSGCPILIKQSNPSKQAMEILLRMCS